MIARIGGRRHDNTLLKQYESIGRLECGSGGIGTHKGAVEERLVEVVDERLVVGAAFAAHEQRRIVGGRRYHGEYLAGGRFDGDYSSDLVDHQRFGVLLELDVDAQLEIAARYGAAVARAVFEFALYLSLGVAYEYFHAFLSAQIALVALLYPEVAGIVARRVVGIGVDIGLRYFAYVA